MDIFKKCSVVLLFNDEPYESANPDFLYHSGCDVDNSILILKKNSKLLLTPKMNYSKAKSQCKFKIVAYSSKNVKEILKKEAKGKIGLNFDSISHARFLRLKKIFGSGIVDLSEDLLLLRAIKTSAQISKIKTAVKIAKQILKEIEPSLSPSKTEIEIEKELKLLCIKHKVSPSFPPIVAAGKNSSNPHHSPSSKKLGNSIVLIDFGVKYQNYCSDLTRCFFLGKCEKEREKYSSAKKILKEIVSSVANLKTAGDLANFSSLAVQKHGFSSLIHSIGHGVGIEVHESPSLYSKSKQPLKPGMVIAIEPGWYGKDFGVRFEENLELTKKRAVLL